MKGALLFIAIFALSLLVIPMIALNYEMRAPEQPAQAQLHSPVQQQEPASEALQRDDVGTFLGGQGLRAQQQPEEESEPSISRMEDVSEFQILDESTGRVDTVSLRDFLRGAVAAEMPASFHSEALKAQAVAAHTFALHNHLVQQRNPDPELRGADFAADPSNMKVYITEEIARNFYGDRADELWGKVCDAADSVAAHLLEYESEPIVAAYHAISAGWTEDAANLWIGSAPYLTAVESGGDLLAPDFETLVEYPSEAVRDAFLAEYPDIAFPEDADEWFYVAERSPSGYVTAIEVGSMTLHGKDVRRVMDLRSHNFEVTRVGEAFRFVVYGYGHGVGLSQYGADFMARQGADFAEILKHYYPGAQITSGN